MSIPIMEEICRALKDVTEEDVRMAEMDLCEDRVSNGDRVIGVVNQEAKRIWALSWKYRGSRLKAQLEEKFNAQSLEERKRFHVDGQMWAGYEEVVRDLFWLAVKKQFKEEVCEVEGIGLRGGFTVVVLSVKSGQEEEMGAMRELFRGLREVQEEMNGEAEAEEEEKKKRKRRTLN